ncbi:MAG TPA: NnrU family protein [Acetobacteraceae bacterium]|jgi:uncharacterized membrane protein|nr:NnrU family protein [Acetobacteraceae bacterium]
MISLLLAALLWTGWHMGVAGTRLRDALVSRLGENTFRGIFSLGSVVSIVLLIIAYNAAPPILLWTIPAWLQWLLVLAMLPAAALFVGSVATRNPTLAGPPAAAPAEVPRGMIRITRHPMLWSFAIWALVHLIGNGDAASFLFFGAFLVTTLAGMSSIDAKLARRDPARWSSIAAATSLIPGRAIAERRNRFVLPELWIPILGGVVLWLLLLFGHAWVIGVPALPG